MIKLRQHQEAAIDKIRDSYRQGNRRVLLAAPCGFGKTLTAAWVAKQASEKGNRVIFFADRLKLVDQTLLAFDAFGLDYGVLQGGHWLTDLTKPIQIASIQTYSRRLKVPEFDFAIVDECHTAYKSISKLMESHNLVKFLGLSATPYSRGLGVDWDDLVVPITTNELIEKNYLVPVHYFGGRSVDVSKVKTKALPTGGSDYDPDELAQAFESDTKLVGDIVINWVARGENSQTIAFCPSIKHSKGLVEAFRRSGISAEHIDGYTPDEERQRLYKGHDSGEFKILSCSRLLGVGYDSPSTRCLIDCRPTKSLIAYQQAAGRVMRIHPGKDYAIYLDHAQNVYRHGFAEDIVPTELDKKTRKYDERSQVKEKENPEDAATRPCPSCTMLMMGIKCRSCGYTIEIRKALESTNELLVRIKGKPKALSMEEKSEFFCALSQIAKQRGYRPGWVAHNYRRRFGVWPRLIDDSVKVPTEVFEQARKFLDRR